MCCSRRSNCWNHRLLVSSAATGRHLFEHIWLLFGGKKKKEQMCFAVRDKSVRALWENMIGRAEELKNGPPYPSCFKLSATVLNSISSVYLNPWKTDAPGLSPSVKRVMRCCHFNRTLGARTPARSIASLPYLASISALLLLLNTDSGLTYQNTNLTFF